MHDLSKPITYTLERNSTVPSGYFSSFIQTSLNAVSEASKRLLPNSETKRESNNETVGETNENEPAG